VTATEFAFLALGLVLGAATGAALVVVLRARPPSPREVRVTVAPSSLARAASTLAHPPSANVASVMDADPAWPAELQSPEPAPAAPMARQGAPSVAEAPPATPPSELDAPRALALGLAPRAVRTGAAPDGTPVPDGGPDDVPVTPGPPPGGSAARARTAVELPASSIGIPIERSDPTATLDSFLRANARENMPVALGVATLEAHGVEMSDAAARGRDQPAEVAPTATAAATAADPCHDQRRAAAERQEVAARAAERARAASASLHDAQRAYDEHVGRAEQAERDADPRAVRAAKDVAQRTFHEARARATSPEARESAARTWLQEINAINLRHRDARATVDREQAAARELLPAIERLSLEADSARIAAETAAAAGRQAQEALAACEEEARRPQDRASQAPPDLAAAARAAHDVPSDEGLPRILAVLRGDEAALDRIVAEIATADDGDERRWRLRLAALVDAIVARAIESAYLDFPEGHRFWGLFTRPQAREVVGALASLGFRYDGLGGFADERVPSQRDLSLAVGYAGLDPMRIRVWPTEREMPLLYREAVVAADQWLAEAGGDLLLGEVVDALGRRADELAEVWNAWGRLRPILLAGA